MQTRKVTPDLPAFLWIALVILGFVLFWPLGLIILFCLNWSGNMRCCNERLMAWKTDYLQRWCTASGASVSTGNMAFDEYRAKALRRLDEERREFDRYVERLRRAKDQDEFDRFMSEQSARRQ